MLMTWLASADQPEAGDEAEPCGGIGRPIAAEGAEGDQQDHDRGGDADHGRGARGRVLRVLDRLAPSST